ncbi:hypothetical protein HBH56_032060 [Parastagonospora nodorum]|uniref:Uncharacterized protein n=1 Tax=Phaeosphaeria nodorum (strain SN15 / ATCC MYA-4574 / FGSC 10173) TaxID=321614 RepID=A0A7U2FCA8_PHANO|nr:hypothetical protein HBH56_032060 [Parastagonospora nodorum]QRD00356.1 hypothetical protein JI435_415130 [Parastagonospora nodorum SN15]KAH3933541.1 hypothetical protein HBH54_067390 [Parastagonospora nodorum]KAH3952734.1 hypothetical protein HBH53_042660 [Parastagonospora nodorum]KAH3979676.1 hypothetical protein HBH51_053690 [Parastagonospora nodorum]
MFERPWGSDGYIAVPPRQSPRYQAELCGISNGDKRRRVEISYILLSKFFLPSSFQRASNKTPLACQITNPKKQSVQPNAGSDASVSSYFV